MRIYLVGFMGSGKSTLGQRAAAAFDVAFFDTDQVVETQAGMTITEIFKTQDENYFRQLEADILRQTNFYSKAIIATGGGLPCYDDNMNWMKVQGITVYLQWPDEIIIRHAQRIKTYRPLLSSLNENDAELKIRDLLQLRKPMYEEAAITIEMKGEEEEDYKLLEKTCKYIW